MTITNEFGKLVAKCPNSGEIEYSLPKQRRVFKGDDRHTFAINLEYDHFQKLDYKRGVKFIKHGGSLEIRGL